MLALCGDCAKQADLCVFLRFIRVCYITLIQAMRQNQQYSDT